MFMKLKEKKISKNPPLHARLSHLQDQGYCLSLNRKIHRTLKTNFFPVTTNIEEGIFNCTSGLLDLFQCRDEIKLYFTCSKEDRQWRWRRWLCVCVCVFLAQRRRWLCWKDINLRIHVQTPNSSMSGLVRAAFTSRACALFSFAKLSICTEKGVIQHG